MNLIHLPLPDLRGIDQRLTPAHDAKDSQRANVKHLVAGWRCWLSRAGPPTGDVVLHDDGLM